MPFIPEEREVVKTVCNLNQCTGCMSCINLCSQNAISVKDSFLAYNAVIDLNKCVNCGLCEMRCPQNNDVQKKKPIEWFQGWAIDQEIRKTSSSGGVATAISSQFIADGGVVVSCLLKDGKFLFEDAHLPVDLLKFAGSKYVKSNPKDAYRIIDKHLKNGRKVLFIGLPCQVAGLKQFFSGKKRTEELYTIDLICHGTPSPQLLESFLLENKRSLSNANTVTFRENNSFGISSDSQPISKYKNRDLYMISFLKKVIYTDSCYECKYACQERCSDITLGDSWGSDFSKEEIRKGISLVLCQTDRGRQLINEANLFLTDVDIDKAILNNENLAHPSVAPGERTIFFSAFIRHRHFTKAFWKAYPVIALKYRLKEVLRYSPGKRGK